MSNPANTDLLSNITFTGNGFHATVVGEEFGIFSAFDSDTNEHDAYWTLDGVVQGQEKSIELVDAMRDVWSHQRS